MAGGLRYPIASLLGIVVLGMLHGQASLLRTWTEASYRWGSLWHVLATHSPHFPVYNMIRSLMANLDADDVDRHLRSWLEGLLGAPLEAGC